MLNPVGGQSLTKRHVCVAVSSRVCEQSVASTFSPPRSEHLIINPLQLHSGFNDTRNIALRLKYFSMFEKSQFCA